MQRIIQITIGGQVIPIEERAYDELNKYITSLEIQFAGEAGKDEIIQDIETRIAELFGARLQGGAQAIISSDVQKVIETLGHPNELNEDSPPRGKTTYQQYAPAQAMRRRLYRNPHDQWVGGVCSGIASYFDIDPVLVRLILLVTILTFGIGILAYLIAWAIIPEARTPQEMYYMSGVPPMDFQTMKKNMEKELQDLKRRGEEMSRDLKEFFNSKNK